MKEKLSLPSFGKTNCKTQSITEFCGYDKTRIKDGMLLNPENVTVLSGGALSSMLAYKKVDINADSWFSLEGIYTFSECCDSDYETYVDEEWVYEYICPEHTLRYETWQKENSRLLIKETGRPPKTEEGYMNVITAFFDGASTFVFYTAEYNIIDERRNAEVYAVGSGKVCQFDSSEDSVRICRFIQVLLDIIDENGEVSTLLVDGYIHRIKSIKEEKYQRSTLISEDGVTYKYASPEYLPNLGKTYQSHYDSVYTDYFPILEAFDLEKSFSHTPKRLVRYSNLTTDTGDDYMSEGKKILVLPDMKLLQKDEYGMWSLHKEPCSSMPDIKAAVQQFDRFYGICDNMTYVSVKGNCTDFTLPEQSPEADGWSMVTNDEGGFTAIAAFDGKVAVFTQNDLITLKGNELPFTLSYDADCGCYSQDAVAVCEGVLYFASRNGIMSYSKNTLKCISRSFEKGIDYSKVRLANVNGAIAVALNNGENVRIYEPASGQWSLLSVGGKNVFVTGTNLIVPNGEYSSLYKMTDSYGEFSFKVALENIGRRRIKSVTVTAEVGEGARLSLSDGKGGELFSISSSDGDTVSRTYYPRGAYFDYGELSFDGKGNVKLYGIFIEYECIRNVSCGIW